MVFVVVSTYRAIFPSAVAAFPNRSAAEEFASDYLASLTALGIIETVDVLAVPLYTEEG